MKTDGTEGLAAGGSQTTFQKELVSALRAMVRQCDDSEADLYRGDLSASARGCRRGKLVSNKSAFWVWGAASVR